MHQGLGVPSDFLTNEVARLRTQLAQTDDELRKLKNANGVVSADETQKAYADQISQIRLDIFSAQVELAEHQAMLGALGGSSGSQTRAPQTFNRPGQLLSTRLKNTRMSVRC